MSAGDVLHAFRVRLAEASDYLLEEGISTELYVIEEEFSGIVKIGLARDPLKRLATLQQGNPRPLRLLFSFTAPHRLEAFLHRELVADRVQGEWFAPTELVLMVVDDLRGFAEIGREIGGYDPDDLAVVFADGPTLPISPRPRAAW